jgi:hypothetical protein
MLVCLETGTFQLIRHSRNLMILAMWHLALRPYGFPFSCHQAERHEKEGKQREKSFHISQILFHRQT